MFLSDIFLSKNIRFFVFLDLFSLNHFLNHVIKLLLRFLKFN
jgi:hypothetical protein